MNIRKCICINYMNKLYGEIYYFLFGIIIFEDWQRKQNCLFENIQDFIKYEIEGFLYFKVE